MIKKRWNKGLCRGGVTSQTQKRRKKNDNNEMNNNKNINKKIKNRVPASNY